MTNPVGKFHDAQGQPQADGSFEYARRYGAAVARLAARALGQTQAVNLTPIRVFTRTVSIPVENKYYRAASELGVLARVARPFSDASDLKKLRGGAGAPEAQSAIDSEVACLHLGDVYVACIPGELYPELVYGRIQDPPDPAADYPTAPPEPSITQLLPGSKWLLFGLANDEVGYIIPQRQWDQVPPFCYGRKRAQYGEDNSCGPLVAPLVMRALADCIGESTR
jgi:hypothetical protein